MNSSPAQKLNQSLGQSLEGLEGFYEEEPGDSQSTAHPGEKFLGIARWLTVEEAAKRLEISSNAVTKRLNKGKLAGRKVAGQFGEKWMVDPSGLPQEIHVQIAEEQPSRAEEEPGNSQGTASPIQEEPSKQESIAEKSFDLFGEVIRQQTEQIKLQNEMIKHLCAQVQDKDAAIKLLTDSQHKKGWWSRFCSWFKP